MLHINIKILVLFHINPGWLASIAEGDSVLNATLLTYILALLTTRYRYSYECLLLPCFIIMYLYVADDVGMSIPGMGMDAGSRMQQAVDPNAPPAAINKDAGKYWYSFKIPVCGYKM